MASLVSMSNSTHVTDTHPYLNKNTQAVRVDGIRSRSQALQKGDVKLIVFLVFNFVCALDKCIKIEV